jgi:hypothetical protein
MYRADTLAHGNSLAGKHRVRVGDLFEGDRHSELRSGSIPGQDPIPEVPEKE